MTIKIYQVTSSFVNIIALKTITLHNGVYQLLSILATSIVHFG